MQFDGMVEAKRTDIVFLNKNYEIKIRDVTMPGDGKG